MRSASASSWQWLQQGAHLTDDDRATGTRPDDTFDATLFVRLLTEEYEKLLGANGVKPPWYIDFLNLNLDNHDLATGRARLQTYIETFERAGTRITENLDF